MTLNTDGVARMARVERAGFGQHVVSKATGPARTAPFVYSCSNQVPQRTGHIDADAQQPITAQSHAGTFG